MSNDVKAMYEARLRTRARVLAHYGEAMFAVIQFHVNGCGPCRSGACSDTMHRLVRDIERALSEGREQ